MKIIAHRGYWKTPEEKNSFQALYRAIDEDFGVETDVRDYRGSLVISHDMPSEASARFEQIFELHAKHRSTMPLALNIKADGLQERLAALIEKYEVTSYFLFDMSVPEMVQYRNRELSYFTRRSDVEMEPVLYEAASGVWIDSFYTDNWGVLDAIGRTLSDGKQAAYVSPELHGRDYRMSWEELKANGLQKEEGFLLCTDHPVEAREFFC